MIRAAEANLRSLRLHRLLLALSVAVPLTVFAIAAARDRARVMHEGEEAVLRTAAVMHEHARTVFETVDLALARVDDRTLGLSWDEIATPAMDAFLARLKGQLDHVVSIWVTDATGAVRAGSRPWDRAISLLDRDFFIAHVNGQVGTYVSAPYRGRASGEPGVAVSRRRSTADGRFDGTIHVMLSHEHLVRAFAEAAPPLAHAAALVRNDGTVLVRRPYREEDSRLPADSALMQAIARAPDRGLVMSRSSVDGQQRDAAYRKVGAYPVHAVFALDVAALERRWRSNLVDPGTVAAAASLTLLLVSGLALRAARAERAAVVRLGVVLEDLRRSETRLQRSNAELEQRVAERTAELREGESRLRMALDAASLGTWRWEVASGDGRLEWDARCKALFGLPESAAADYAAWTTALLEEDRSAAEAAVARALDPSDPHDDVVMEYRVHAGAGRVRWLAVNGRAFFVPDPTAPAGRRAVRILGTIRDATDAREATEALSRSNEEARAAAERVQLALAAGAIVGTWDWEIPTDRITVDERFAESFGVDPALGRTGLSLEQVIATVHPEDLAGLRTAIAEAMARGGPFSHEYRVRGLDGAYRWIEANGRVDLAADGSPARFPGVLIDIGARRALEAERDRAAALLRAFIAAVPGVVYAKDREGRMLVANEGTARLVGRKVEELLGRTDGEFLDDPIQAAVVMANDQRIMRSGASEQVEESVSLPDGTPAVWLSTKAPFRDGRGEVMGLVGASVDITERKRAEDRLRLMVDELNHRVKNTLAAVQSIALYSLRGTDPAVRRGLEARLLALAAAHDVLTRERWEGADVDEVVAGILAPHGGTAGGRFRVSGPALRLAPRAAVALSMALHELATNALKYGALSVPAGHVEVRWEVVRGPAPRFRLVWTERGGPLVSPPASRGFGTRLVERGLAQDLGGTAVINFAYDGVVCTVEADLAGVAAAADVVPLPRVGWLGD